MKDYRLQEHRPEFFTKLYKMNLDHGVMPGLVYLYIPELKKRLDWSDSQASWFAFLNGMTQNPITSLVMHEQLPDMPTHSDVDAFDTWFNANWENLAFDTDRRYGKKETIQAIHSYITLVERASMNHLGRFGDQKLLFEGKTYEECWDTYNQVHSFGRLSTFSGLEYHNILGSVPDCSQLMFDDKSGSKSHRNGMLIFLNRDELVWDKRVAASPLIGEGHSGNYTIPSLKLLAENLEYHAENYLTEFKEVHPETPNVSKFTLESNCCTFKNSFFGRRFPGVYSFMANERIKWYDKRGMNKYTEVFKEIREDKLPLWLRPESNGEKRSITELAAIFPNTGVPYNAEHFL